MMDFKTDTILVTGAGGWLGCGLLDGLVKGLPGVKGLNQSNPNLAIRAFVQNGQDVSMLRKLSTRMEIVSGDLRSPADCARFCANAKGSVLFHTAGVIHPQRVRDFYDINVKGTEHVMQAALAAGVRRAVVVSSNSPCGCNPQVTHQFDENSPYNPYMNYGRSKMLMEKFVTGVAQAGNIETVLIRPPWFYGPYQPARQTLFFRMIRDGRCPLVGAGENRRSMVYIENLVQGLMLAALVPAANKQTYWIADQRAYSMNEILDTIERLLENEFGEKCAHKRVRLPAFLGDIAELADKTLQACGLYQQKIHVLSEMNKTIACSIAKAQRELGYQPAVDLEEGMRRSLVWMKEQGLWL